jgi:hypothetical protein
MSHPDTAKLQRTELELLQAQARIRELENTPCPHCGKTR